MNIHNILYIYSKHAFVSVHKKQKDTYREGYTILKVIILLFMGL